MTKEIIEAGYNDLSNSVDISKNHDLVKIVENTIEDLDKGRINLDKRLLESYYKNNGYYNVTIKETFAEFQDDNSFKLIYNIDSGLKYYFNNINLILPADYKIQDFSKFDNAFSNKPNWT